MKRYFEKRVVRKEFFIPLDGPDKEISENGITVGTSKQREQLKGFVCPSPTTVTCRKIPDDFFPRGLSESSCMQLSLSVFSMTDNSNPTISAQQLSIASLEAEEVSPCDLSRSSIMSMDTLLEDLKQKQDEDTGSETKDASSETKKLKQNLKQKHKQIHKQKSPKKNDTSTKPCEASTSHRHPHGQDQDQAKPRYGSTVQQIMNRYGKSLKRFPLQPSKTKEEEVIHTHHKHRPLRIIDEQPWT